MRCELGIPSYAKFHHHFQIKRRNNKIKKKRNYINFCKELTLPASDVSRTCFFPFIILVIKIISEKYEHALHMYVEHVTLCTYSEKGYKVKVKMELRFNGIKRDVKIY